MTTYAYLRVSTIQQDEQNQRLGVDKKAQDLGLTIDKYIIDHISGVKEPEQRNLGKLLRKLKKGDTLIIAELSRLGRRLFMLFRILENILKNGINLYSVKEGFNLDDSLPSKAIIFSFGLAVELEQRLISARTREALALRKRNGVRLGRPFGSMSSKYKLDDYKDKIIKWNNKGWSKNKIAKNCHVCTKTLRQFMDKHCIA